MIDESEVIDSLDVVQLRAFAHHQNRLVQRLLSEREGHLRSVEAAFRVRHNVQQQTIAGLEQQVRVLKSELNQRKKAS